ncbi:hypothetical protein [Draconibacterium halophilum]|uniref:Outer membrane protein beta-barrel domain-containing protein n=1 Tax=Draconibacterium halophilum TaxID=2706887 RepID=A0A6C0RGZ9_9BACT|nr:hypothetical protein [Draconibacterium halophilum]QIA08945.1 hypothetical protein G0Q07_15025 [Draconibacterium halophilum]
MNWIKHMCFIVLFFGISALTLAQNETVTPSFQTSKPNGLYIGGQISTNGFGGNLRYALNDKFSFRAGYETLSLSYDFNFDENDISYNANMDFKTGGLLALVDFAYTKNLYISAGAVFSSFNTEVTGYAISDFEYGDIIIPSEEIGDFLITAKPGLSVSPYGGAGYRSFWGKREGIVFSFETGLYYMGPPDIEIEATGLLAPTADPAFGQAEYLEYQFDAYKIYPVIKLGLAVKLF